jgi:glycerol-3-phosphate dehydrogenase
MARSLAGECLIAREPQAAASHRYDLAVIGGGIHGACVALEATRRGLRVLLVEAADFGIGASGNSLRILHGGLRYLQSADLVRFRESVAERRWYAHTFPELVDPLSCLMPLYGEGLKRRSVMRVALTLNDWLSRHRNDGMPARVRLPGGGTFGVRGTQARFAAVRRVGLEGAALWHDYLMRSSERILIEILHWACRLGARALNYAPAVGLQSEGGQVTGLTVVDQLTGEHYDFKADRVCNCTGSLARNFAAPYGREHTELFIPSLAFNVLFDCDRLGEDALGVAAPEAGAPVYFLCPSPHGIWAGTEHVARPEGCVVANVTEAELLEFVGRINRAIPSIGLSLHHVRRVFSGLLPVKTAATTSLTAREAIVNHARSGGLRGLYSVTGIKFTTARKVGERAVNEILNARRPASLGEEIPPISQATGFLLDGARVATMNDVDALRLIREVAGAESALCAQDFCLRRTNWIFTAPDFEQLERLAARALTPRQMPPQRAGDAAASHV